MTCKNFEEVCNEVLAFCLHEFWLILRMTTFCILDSLTTTYGEAGLPTSTARREAYERLACEGGAQGSGLATFLIKHTHGGGRLRTC
jgi:hypothetical protein